MRFIAKKEFELAVETIELAIKNGQVRYGHHDSTVGVEEVVFVAEGGETLASNRLSFVSPFVAAQQQLIRVRKSLSDFRTQSELNQRAIEQFEKVEKKLAELVPTLKE
jgi:hypothetical protein